MLQVKHNKSRSSPSLPESTDCMQPAATATAPGKKVFSTRLHVGRRHRLWHVSSPVNTTTIACLPDTHRSGSSREHTGEALALWDGGPDLSHSNLRSPDPTQIPVSISREVACVQLLQDRKRHEFHPEKNIRNGCSPPPIRTKPTTPQKILEQLSSIRLHPSSPEFSHQSHAAPAPG